MADPMHLEAFLKGPEYWNRWRVDNDIERPDLSGANLDDVDLRDYRFVMDDLSEASLRRADLRGVQIAINMNRADLEEANLLGANVGGTQMEGANLRKANLRNASLPYMLTGANMEYADCVGAKAGGINMKFIRGSFAKFDRARFEGTRFNGAVLNNASFKKCEISRASFGTAKLDDADFTGARLERVSFELVKFKGTKFTNAVLFRASLGQMDLSGAELADATLIPEDFRADSGSLELPNVRNSVRADYAAVERSMGRVPDHFLEKSNIHKWEALFYQLYDRSLRADQIREISQELGRLRAKESNEKFTVVISYSHRDKEFVERLEERLRDNDVETWRDEDRRILGPISRHFRSAVEHYRVVVLVLSSHSMRSEWVQDELAFCREFEEQQNGASVLCPIVIDKNWSKVKIPAENRKALNNNIPVDFCGLANKKFEDSLEKLIRLLRTMYGRPSQQEPESS